MSTSTLVTNAGKVSSGVLLNSDAMENLYAPQEVRPYTPPPTGIDNLGITSVDRFFVPNMGEFNVDFEGFVRVSRSVPTADDWTSAEVYTNLIEMKMVGRNDKIGDIVVTLNPDYLSTGQLRTPFDKLDQVKPEKACRMAVGALFHVPSMGKVLFNKEPIELTIDHVSMIPPAGNPGVGRIYRSLPLYDLANPDGHVAAYLTSLDFAMGTYLTQDELEARRNAGPALVN